jgi:hypothetical protein
MHMIPWITTSYPPWLQLQIGVGKIMLQTHHEIEGIKCGL